MGEYRINPLFNVHDKYKTMNVINPYRHAAGAAAGPYIVVSDFDTGLSYLSDDGGSSWSQITDVSFAAGQTARSAGASLDGSLLMIQGNGNSSAHDDFWKSTDYGASWTRPNQNPGAKWNRGCNCTSDAKYSIATNAGGTDCEYSTNFGSSYALDTSVSFDCYYQTIGYNPTDGVISTYGARSATIYFKKGFPNGTPTTGTAPASVYSGCMSDDGAHCYYGRGNSTNIAVYKTTNWGSSFTTRSLGTATAVQNTDVSCSASGQYVLAYQYNSNPKGAWVSNDYGDTYTFVNMSSYATLGPAAASTGNQCVSKSGKYMVLGNRDYNGKIIFSDDYGVTWSPIQTPCTNRIIACSVSG